MSLTPDMMSRERMLEVIGELEAEVERLKGVLERLASSEAFHQSHVLVARDAELIMRMDFARSALEAKP